MAYYDNYLQGFIELIRVKKIMLDASLTLLIALSGKIYIIKAKPLAFIFFNNNYRSKTIYLLPENSPHNLENFLINWDSIEDN